ncbi:MAG: hypothetical protein E7028_02925 [Planctomycetaceae bacterium]|nr:hypothetical protein [Planctomycetaceae bacterium]
MTKKRMGHLFLKLAVLGILLAGVFFPLSVHASDILLKDGRHLLGREGMLPKFGELPQYSTPEAQIVPMNIVFMDDDLRRTYVSKKQVADVFSESDLEVIPERFVLRQKILEKGAAIKGMGILLKEEPFDEFGRRTIRMSTAQGPKDIIQCITVITPFWTKVECTNFIWDMRIATTNIPVAQLLPILRRQAIRLTKGSEVEAAQKIARFFIQAERYELAAYELNRVIQQAEGEEAESLKKTLAPTLAIVRQLSAKRALNELKFRQSKGQYGLVQDMLEQFPAKGIAGETLVQVRELKKEYEVMDQRIEKLIENIQKCWLSLKDESIKAELKPVLVEILESVNYSTLPRMEAFESMMDIEGTDVQELISLAVTSWLMGSKEASDRIVIAVSAVRVRQLIQDFMEADDDMSREAVFRKFRQEEAGSVKIVSAILSHMKPPVRVGKDEWQGKDGFFRLQTPSTVDDQPINYWVQLPLEYDPRRLYPAVICLHGAMDDPLKEMEWWTGGFDPKGFRYGQAGRNGYVVISIDWMNKDQRNYEYSAREHAAVLNVLHHVTQRFSIDTDRIFLSGHFEGGEAAWDIASAHPDLWAGLIPISARAEKYCAIYWSNLSRMPIYFICGELDNQILAENANVLSRYSLHGYDMTVAEYLGRGREAFSDEILRLFDWMERKKRDFYPAEFEVRTMRPWDNFFWWVDVEKLPPNAVVLPAEFPRRGMIPAKISAELLPAVNTLKANVPTGKITFWVGPGMLDFEQPINFLVNGKKVRVSRDTKPDLRILLDDVRQRGDRQNPFWQKLEADTGRVK